jgi:hypothetical protein
MATITYWYLGKCRPEVAFVQDNHGRNPLKGTLRGLHYQVPLGAQGKLVRVTRGAVFDVAVDIRRGSPSFGRHAAAVLTADNWYQLWIPPGYRGGRKRYRRGRPSGSRRSDHSHTASRRARCLPSTRCRSGPTCLPSRRPRGSRRSNMRAGQGAVRS